MERWNTDFIANEIIFNLFKFSGISCSLNVIINYQLASLEFFWQRWRNYEIEKSKDEVFQVVFWI